MKLALFPDGSHVVLDNLLRITTALNVITFDSGEAAPQTYTANQTQLVLKQIYAAINSNVNGNIKISDPTGSAAQNVYLASITPVAFSVTAGSSGSTQGPLAITGSGFTPAMNTIIPYNGGSYTVYANAIYIEDLVGGTDSNSTAMQITYVSPSLIYASLYSIGDNAFGGGANLPNCIVYFQGLGWTANGGPGNISNILSSSSAVA